MSAGDHHRVKNFIGPPTWKVLHSLGAGPSTPPAGVILRLINAIRELFPCEKCRQHFREKMTLYPIDEYLKHGPSGLFLYFYWIHDLVNIDINRESGEDLKESPELATVKKQYQEMWETSLAKQSWWDHSVDKTVSLPYEMCGKEAWRMIHGFAATYKPSRRAAFLDFLQVMGELFQSECYLQTLSIYPPTLYLDNNHDAFFYTYLLHDLVNQDINQRSGAIAKESPNYTSLKSRYFSILCGDQCHSCTNV